MQADEDWRRAVDELPSGSTITRALGEELWRTREELGLSRAQVAARMPSGIGDRTLLSYEHGTRHVNVLRWVEISSALVVPAPVLLARGLQRARIQVKNLSLTVDLRFLLNDRSDKFRPMMQWARNTLNEHPDGVVEIEPAVVRHLALFVGCGYLDLANYLARFIPENRLDRQESDESPE